jgi:uncharacterized protein YodC (DUF2158 family)
MCEQDHSMCGAGVDILCQHGAVDVLYMVGDLLMTQLQPGDVVRLKSGGPCMLITALGGSSGWTMSAAHTASCRWFEGRKQQETIFDVALLEKLSAPGTGSRARIHQPVG